MKKQVLESDGDLENVALPISTAMCGENENGTTITLTNLNTNLSLPRAEALKELLALEYGREQEFEIFVNKEPLAHEDIPGQKFSATIQLPSAGVVTINFTIMDHPAPKGQAGIVMRVGGKVVGKPTFLGLDDNQELPGKLLRHVVGEVVADSLEDDITADGGAIIENSVAYQEARKWIRSQVSTEVRKKFHDDVREQFSRRQKTIERRLSHLPLHRREFARRQLQRVLQKFYGETADRINTVVNLMLDALEQDEYWLVCEHLNEARASDVHNLADALAQFGLVDLAVIGQQARRRLEFLDHLDTLEGNPKTLEKEMHNALDTNLWVFGPQYSMMASNRTLAATIEGFTGKKFKGKRSAVVHR
jgi:hypothetical protein